MAETLTADKVVARCNALKTFWNPRTDKMKSWYELIQMVDKLAQSNMESFVGNDPRASFNLVLSMLEQKIPHRVPSQDVTQEMVTAASELGKLFDTAWEDVFYSYRRRGRKYLRDLIGLLLATGWYAVFATITLDGTKCIADIWNPASVFQSWEDDLIECAHVFSVSPVEAQRMITRAGWTVSAPASRTTCYDYWKLDDNGNVYNSVVIGRSFAKPETLESRFNRIPIFTAPAGGLPDTGLLSNDTNRYKGELGQSAMVTNENIYRSWNRWWTFSMQLLRDTAQPRWIEKSTSATRIVKPEDIFKYGSIFKMGLQDSFEPIHMPPIPVEIRASQLDMEAMMQRGGPTWAAFGNVQQQLSAYVMSQISASLRNITKPFHDSIIDLFTDIDNFWLDMIRAQHYKPYGKGLPAGLPDDIRITAEYEIKIPGDIIQRATAARMLDPNFELSPDRVMEEFFPEIKNPIEEMAKIRAAKAERDPVRVLIAMVEAFKQEAAMLAKAHDTEGARLYNKAAAKLEASLDIVAPTQGGQEGGQATPEQLAAAAAAKAPGRRPEAIPPTGSQPAVA